MDTPTDSRPSKIPRLSLPSLDDDETSSEQSTEKFGKVWLICCCRPKFEQGVFSYGEDVIDIDHCLFLLDLDADESAGDAYVPRNPDLCLDSSSLGVSGFCIVGSTLYLFGIDRELFKYDLPSCSIPTLPYSASSLSSSPPLPLPREVATLTFDLLTDVGCSMNFSKHGLMACRTPDGKKMLALSSMLSAREEDCGKFELFDFAEKKWTPLPDLLPLLLSQGTSFHKLLLYPHPKTCICVCSISFIDNGDVLLVVTTVGNFTLNIQQRGCEWLKFNGFQFPINLYPDFMLVGDGFCLTDWYAWVGGGGGASSYRLPSYPSLSLETCRSRCNIGGGITWLSSDLFCAARSHVDLEELHPHLIIDVWSFDSDDFRGRKKNDIDGLTVAPNLKLMKRIKFVLGPQAEDWEDWFSPKCLCSIP